MPEMTKGKKDSSLIGKKKRKKSLAKAAQRAVGLVALIIFAVSTYLNWNFMKTETVMMITQQVNNAVTVVDLAAMRISGLKEIAASAMDIYRQIPEEIRAAEGEEYYAEFEALEKSDLYVNALSQFQKDCDDLVVENAYIGAYDPDTQTMVCVLGPGSNSETVFSSSRLGYRSVITKDQAGFFEDVPAGKVEALIDRTIQAGKGLDAVFTRGMSLSDEDGNKYAYAMADVPVLSATIYASLFTIFYFVILLVIIVVIIIVARFVMGRRIVKPVRIISDATEKYIRNKREGKTEERCFDNLQIRTRDELEELGDVMSDMETSIAEYEKNLMKATAERERLQTELSVAAKIQIDLLPSRFPAFPERTDFDIFATMNPAREVGGDFYDFFMIDENHLGIVMADVSGKGIPAALFMMSSMIIINNYASEGYSPAVVLEKSNEKICATDMEDMFVTVWFGSLDLCTGQLTAANAGHEYPIIRHAGGLYELYHDKHGFVLGGMNGIRYKEYTLTLEPGSTIFVYTDGVPEAMDAQNNMYGTDRLVKALNRNPDAAPKELLASVREDVDRFVKDESQFDDLTMLAVKYIGQETPPAPQGGICH